MENEYKEETVKKNYIVTPDLRKEVDLFGFNLFELVGMAIFFLGSIITVALTQKLIPLPFVILLIYILLKIKPGVENNMYTQLKKIANFLFLKQQRYQKEDLEKTFSIDYIDDISKGDIKVGDEVLFFYDYPTLNIPLASEDKMNEVVRELASILETIDAKVEIFSYELYANIKANIEHKRTLLDNSIINVKQAQALYSIKEDLIEKELDSKTNDKAFCFIVRMDLKKNLSITRSNLDIMLQSHNIKRMNRKNIKSMLDIYLTKSNSKFEKFDTMKFSSDCVNTDDVFVKTFLIKEFPAPLHAGKLSRISNINHLNILIKYEQSQTDIDSLINNFGNLINQQSNSYDLADKIKSINSSDKAKDFYSEILDQNSKIIDTTVYIQIYGKSRKELYNNINTIRKKMKAEGITLDSLNLMQKEGYFSFCPILPGEIKKVSRTMLSTTAAALYPMSYVYKNDIKGAHLGRIEEGSDIYLDTTSRSSNSTNGNLLGVGTSGGGKSVTLNNLSYQNMSFGKKTFFIDPDGERRKLVESFDGAYGEVTSGKTIINLLEPRYLGTDEEQELIDMESNEIILNHYAFFKNCFSIYKPDQVRDNTNLLTQLEIYLVMLFSKYKIQTNGDYFRLDPKDFPIISDLFNLIKNEEHELVTEEERRQLLLSLNSMVYGSDALLFNGHTNISDKQYVSFAIKELLLGDKHRKNVALYNILTYIFSLSSRYREETDISIDELATLFDEDAPLIAHELANLWKRARKYNLNMYGFTQNFNDLNKGAFKEILSAIISNSNKTLLFKPGLGNEMSYIRKAFNLTSVEVDKISKFSQGQYMLFEGNDKYIVNSYNQILPSVWEVIK